MSRSTIKNSLALSLIGLLTAACSSTPDSNDKASQAGLVCTKVAPTGSHMAKKQCTTAAEREAASRQAAEVMTTPTGNARSR